MTYKILIPVFAFVLVISSCKNDEGSGDAEPSPKPSDLTLLKNDEWKVAAKQSIFMPGSGQGGFYGTVAFAVLNTGELRWYTLHSTMANFSGHNEMLLNLQGQVTIDTDLQPQAYGGDLKAMVEDDTWKINRSFDRADVIAAFKNDQVVDLSKFPEGTTKIVRIHAADDGFLNSSNNMTSNYVTHYDFGTQRWKNNTFTGNNFVAVRYDGLTYAIAFTRFTAADGTYIFAESQDKVVVPDTQIPSLYSVHYPMTQLNYVAGQNGEVIHASVYDDNVIVVFQAYLSAWRYAVVKINLTDHSVELVQSPDPPVPFGLAVADILYNHSYVEVDDAGNLYVVENRVENQTPSFSIRRYNANGGSEVFLRETDLIPETQIQAIRFYNGKLHVAIVNRQELPDNNPGDNYFPINYHMQIICPK